MIGENRWRSQRPARPPGVVARVEILKGIIDITAADFQAFELAAARQPEFVRELEELSRDELRAERRDPFAAARREHARLEARDHNLDMGLVPHVDARSAAAARRSARATLFAVGADDDDQDDNAGSGAGSRGAPGFEFSHHPTVDSLPVESAATWLADVFHAADYHDLPAGPVKTVAGQKGFKQETLRRACTSLQIESRKVGRSWWWSWTLDRSPRIQLPKKPLGIEGHLTPPREDQMKTGTIKTPPPFDWEAARTDFLVKHSWLSLEEVLLIENYERPTGPDADFSLIAGLPTDWYPRIVAAWDAWDALLDELIRLAGVRESTVVVRKNSPKVRAALAKVVVSGGEWSELQVATAAGLTVGELRAVLQAWNAPKR